MYKVYSPDGFTIECAPGYKSLKAATAALDSFVARFASQGYYSTGNRERIPFADIKDYCLVERV